MNFITNLLTPIFIALGLVSPMIETPPQENPPLRQEVIELRQKVQDLEKQGQVKSEEEITETKPIEVIETNPVNNVDNLDMVIMKNSLLTNNISLINGYIKMADDTISDTNRYLDGIPTLSKNFYLMIGLLPDSYNKIALSDLIEEWASKYEYAFTVHINDLNKFKTALINSKNDYNVRENNNSYVSVSDYEKLRGEVNKVLDDYKAIMKLLSDTHSEVTATFIEQKDYFNETLNSNI